MVQVIVRLQRLVIMGLRHPHFQEFGTISGNPRSLSGDLSRKHQVFKYLLVNTGKCAGTRSLLLGARVTSGSTKHTALGDEDDVSVRELLFQFPGEPWNGVLIDINTTCSLVSAHLCWILR